jgi:hypothetical protein
MPNTLREAVKRRFYPFVEARGFSRIKSTDSLFTTFRKGDAEVAYKFEMQWDKYHRPYFILNFSKPDGAKMPTRTEHGRLQRKRGGSMNCWFNLRRPWLEVLRAGRLSYTPDEVVDQLISCFPEIEEWWSTGTEGAHVYCI